MSYFKDVLEFHQKFGCHIGSNPSVPEVGTAVLRQGLMDEEYQELNEALDKEDLPGIADGVADLIYVLCGLAISYGINLDDVWAAVHKANMKKVGGKTRPDGKILKPEGWTHPDIKTILMNPTSGAFMIREV